MVSETVASRVLQILETVAETPQVREDLDVALFSRGLLDSFGIVQLIVALDQELGIEISPAEIDRARWASPRLIIADVEERLQRVSLR